MGVPANCRHALPSSAIQVVQDPPGEDALGAATAIVNAKVFDGTKSQDWTSVRFADGLITGCSVASAAQEGDEVIDAGGGTVLPGLIDAHVHLVPGALAQSLTFGVTTVLDMFSKPGLVASAKEQAASRPDVDAISGIPPTVAIEQHHIEGLEKVRLHPAKAGIAALCIAKRPPKR